MFVDKNSIIINGLNMGPFILEAKYEYNKLWGNDSGRNLAGKMTGTLLGIFPKIILTFKKLSKEELNTVSQILDSPSQTVEYYDPYKNRKITMTTYTGDWKITNNNINSNQSFDCSFISISKR